MENRIVNWNHKVAKARGAEWRKKLLLGRLDVQTHPSVLRIRRIRRNKTQVEIAGIVGMSYTTYGAVESGRRPVSKERAEKIAKCLSLSFDKAFIAATIGKGRFQARRDSHV